MKEDGHGILFQKLFWPTRRKNCSSDWEKVLKIPVRSLIMFKNQQSNLFEQSKGQNFFETKYFFNFLLDVSKEEARSKVTIGTNNLDVKIYRNYLGICQPWPYESEYVYDYINGYSKVKLMYI